MIITSRRNRSSLFVNTRYWSKQLPMWEQSIEVLNDDRIHKVSVCHDGEPVTYRDVLSLWKNDASFRTYFLSMLAESPFPAYRWETPAITEAND